MGLFVCFPFAVGADETFTITKSGSTYTYTNANGVVTTDTLFASRLINMAISDAHGVQGVVRIQAGTYVLNASIVPQSNVRVQCVNDAIFTIEAPASLGDSLSIILATGALTNFSWDGGVVDGAKGSLLDHRGSGTWNTNFFKYFGIGVYSDYPSSNVVFSNVTVKNVIGQGIALRHCQNSWVVQCMVVNAGDNPITLDVASDRCVVEYCTVEGGQDVGINTWSATNCVIRNNHVENVMGYSASDASHWGIASEYSTNTSIVNNYVYGCAYNIVVGGAAAGTHRTLVSDNTVVGTSITKIGIEIQASDNTLVQYNHLINCTDYKSISTYGGSTTHLYLVRNFLTNSLPVDGGNFPELDGPYTPWSVFSGWEDSGGTDVTDNGVWFVTHPVAEITTVANTGNYALSVTSSPTDLGGYVGRYLSKPSDHVVVSFFFSFSDWPAENNQRNEVMQLQGNGVTEYAVIYFKNGTNWYIAINDYTAGAYYGVKQLVLSADSYYNITCEYERGTSGRYKLYVWNELVIDSGPIDNSAENPINAVYLLASYAYGEHWDFTNHIDDVFVITDFASTPSTLTMNAVSGGSTVPAAGSYELNSGLINFTATANSGYEFRGWLIGSLLYPSVDAVVEFPFWQDTSVTPVFVVPSGEVGPSPTPTSPGGGGGGSGGGGGGGSAPSPSGTVGPSPSPSSPGWWDNLLDALCQNWLLILLIILLLVVVCVVALWSRRR